MSAAFMDYDPAIGGYRFIRLTTEEPSLETGERRTTDEGWSATYTTWTLDAESGTVTCEWMTDGVDCDGRMSDSGASVCAIADLAGRIPYVNEGEEALPFGVPEWSARESSHRDYSAEAAGY